MFLFLGYPFNRSVVTIIPLLTGVSSKCFHFAKFIFYSSISNRSVVSSLQYRIILSSFHLFSTGVLSKFCHSCSLTISSYRGGHILFVREALISMSFNLQGSHNVPCSSLLTECLQSRSPPLYSFFRFV